MQLAALAGGNHRELSSGLSVGREIRRRRPQQSSRLSPMTIRAAFTEKGFKATAGALKVGDVVMIHDNDAARELSQVRGLPTESVNMLVNTVVAAGEVPMVARRKCQQNSVYSCAIWEIPAWFTPPDVGDYFVSYNTANSVLAGYEVATALFKSIGGEGTVVHIKGLATPTDDARTAGMMKAAKDFPGIKIVGGLRGDWVREKARERDAEHGHGLSRHESGLRAE